VIDFRPILVQPPEVLERVRQMRNQESVRKAMFTDHEISPTEHAAWLERLPADESRRVRVVFLDGFAVGVVALEKINWTHKTCGWAYYLDEAVRGRGVGLTTAKHALSWAFDELLMEKLNGEALAFNETSWGIDLKLGMKEEGRIRSAYVKDGKRVDVVLVGMTRDEWLATKLKVAA
jgi:UDP-4-amino-4,6-dideoxy-N-acetyl-beta-L-altrosamine N-acetyltransferase